MPAHSSHLLLPLDVSCFSVLKRCYGQEVENYMRAGINHIDKPDFLEAYLSARTKAMIPNTVCSGFTATGLVLYDPEQVLSKLNTQLQTLTLPVCPLNILDNWVPGTPANIAALERQTKAIKHYIRRRTTSPPSPTDVALDQLVKGCQLAMHNAVLLAEENKQLQAANERQKRKRKKKREYIATGGVLTVQEGLNRSQTGPIQAESGVAVQTVTEQTRAPRTCSICKSLVHTARTCPEKQVSN